MRALAAVVALWALSAASTADVKVVARVRSENNIKRPSAYTSTSYYRGTKVRNESLGRVTIFDMKARTTTVLNPKSRTYWVTSMSSSMETPKGMTVKLSGKVKPAPGTRTIAGKRARKYVFDGQMTMTYAMALYTAKMKLHLEQWTTSQIKTTMSPNDMMAMAGQVLQSLGPAAGSKQLQREFTKVRGFPLSNRASADVVAPSVRPGVKPTRLKMNLSNDVISIKEGPISASLFQIPKGYRKVAAPSAPKS